MVQGILKKNSFEPFLHYIYDIYTLQVFQIGVQNKYLQNLTKSKNKEGGSATSIDILILWNHAYEQK